MVAVDAQRLSHTTAILYPIYRAVQLQPQLNGNNIADVVADPRREPPHCLPAVAFQLKTHQYPFRKRLDDRVLVLLREVLLNLARSGEKIFIVYDPIRLLKYARQWLLSVWNSNRTRRVSPGTEYTQCGALTKHPSECSV